MGECMEGYVVLLPHASAPEIAPRLNKLHFCNSAALYKAFLVERWVHWCMFSLIMTYAFFWPSNFYTFMSLPSLHHLSKLLTQYIQFYTWNPRLFSIYFQLFRTYIQALALMMDMCRCDKLGMCTYIWELKVVVGELTRHYQIIKD